MTARDTIGLLKASAAEWSEDKASRLAAALSYYTIFSIAPLLIIAVAVAGAVLGDEAARGQLAGGLEQTLGPTGAEAVQMMVANAAEPTTGGILGTIFGVLVLLWAASNLFAALQDALNTIWEVAPCPDRGFWGTVKDRVTAFALVMGVGVLLLASVVLSTMLMGAAKLATGFLADNAIVLQLANVGVSIIVFSLLFAVIYKYLPDVRIRWSDVWFGAVTTAVLFVLGKFLIGLYLGMSSVSSSFGAAGSLVALLVWIYYSAQVFFFGAELTQVHAQRSGRHIEPSRGAIRLTDEMRAKQGRPRKQPIAERPAAREGSAADEAHRPAAPLPPPAAASATPPRGAVAAASDGAQERHRSGRPPGALAAGDGHDGPSGAEHDGDGRRDVASALLSGLVELGRRTARHFPDARQEVQRRRTGTDPRRDD
jgi:membrane protein